MFTTVLSLVQGTYSVHFEQKTWGLFLKIPDDLPDPMIIFLNVFFFADYRHGTWQCFHRIIKI